MYGDWQVSSAPTVPAMIKTATTTGATRMARLVFRVAMHNMVISFSRSLYEVGEIIHIEYQLLLLEVQ